MSWFSPCTPKPAAGQGQGGLCSAPVSACHEPTCDSLVQANELNFSPDTYIDECSDPNRSDARSKTENKPEVLFAQHVPVSAPGNSAKQRQDCACHTDLDSCLSMIDGRENVPPEIPFSTYPPPKEDENNFDDGGNDWIAFGAGCVGGTSHVSGLHSDFCLHEVNYRGRPDEALFAVFARQTSDVAKQCKYQLSWRLEKALGNVSNACSVTEVEHAIQMVHSTLDELLGPPDKNTLKASRSLGKVGQGISMPEPEPEKIGDNSYGLSGVTCYISGSNLYTACAGSCRAVLSQLGKALEINGGLGAGRSLSKIDDFIILGCDGFWQRRSPQEVVSYVSESFRGNGPLTISRIVEDLLAMDKLTSTGVAAACIVVDLTMVPKADDQYESSVSKIESQEPSSTAAKPNPYQLQTINEADEPVSNNSATPPKKAPMIFHKAIIKSRTGVTAQDGDDKNSSNANNEGSKAAKIPTDEEIEKKSSNFLKKWLHRRTSITNLH